MRVPRKLKKKLKKVVVRYQRSVSADNTVITVTPKYWLNGRPYIPKIYYAEILTD